MTEKDDQKQSIEEETVEAVDQAGEAKDEDLAEENTEVTALQDQVSELDDKLLRAQAEIQNIQQRNAREVANIRKYDGQDLAAAILPAVDNLERAVAVEADDDVARQIKAGVEMTLKTMRQALKDHGITETGAVGEPFDPQSQQAIQTVEDADVPADHIAQVLQKGYRLHDRVIRPAMVAVAK
ncbi:nucleotide exchange factor GrpE [Lactobacillaceae bacterium L1_55_11]|nr:nucleotide exchange factor GrpE [Lactobacillaceae bacterium L1_55_11]